MKKIGKIFLNLIGFTFLVWGSIGFFFGLVALIGML